MQIELLVVGTTVNKEVQKLIADYSTRLKHYVIFKIVTVDLKKKTKNMDQQTLLRMEGEKLLKMIAPSATLILLDEGGKSFSSEGFADFLQKQMNMAGKKIIFCIGGAYGFDKSVYERANASVSLSPMTYTHQMVRLIFVEQLYRAFTILGGEKYHH